MSAHRLQRPRLRVTGTLPVGFTARWAETDRADDRRTDGCFATVFAVAFATYFAAFGAGAGWW